MKHARLVVPVVVVCLAAATAAAQSFQGGLRGTVKDAQGVIPGVTVTLVNQETGVARETASNQVGEYSFPGVVPGVYTVRAAVSGFKTFVRSDARIGTQQFLTLDIVLEIRERSRRSPASAAWRSSRATRCRPSPTPATRT